MTAEFTPSRMAPKIVDHLKMMLRVYRSTGYVVRCILMDRKLEKIKSLSSNVVCNTNAAKEHVAEIERKIRVVKERTIFTASPSHKL